MKILLFHKKYCFRLSFDTNQEEENRINQSKVDSDGICQNKCLKQTEKARIWQKQVELGRIMQSMAESYRPFIDFDTFLEISP